MTGQPQRLPEELASTRIVLRPIANPLSLGFLGLAGATLSAAGLELGWIPPGEHLLTGLVVLIFAPTLQLIACVFGFLGRDAVAATGMGVMAATWAVIGIAILIGKPGANAALGTLLMVSSAGVLLSANTAAHSKVVPALVMATTGLRFFTTGLYQLTAVADVKLAAGVLGCVLSAEALYAAIALEIEDVRRQTVLPTLRRNKGTIAMEPSLGRQVEDVANEAGVRRSL